MMILVSLQNPDWVLIRQAISLSLAHQMDCRIAGALEFLNCNPHITAFLSDIEEFCVRYDFGNFSTEGNDVLFYPKFPRFGNFTISINPYSSAIELMLLLMPALFKQIFRSRLYLSGVTHSPFTFGTSWMKESFLAALEQMGMYASCTLRRFGFYASGGGLIEAKVYPAEAKRLSEFNIPGDSARFTGARIYIAHLDSSIAVQEKNFLCEDLGLDEAQTGILEIRDCDGAWNHAEIYCLVDGLPVVFSETVPVYDFSGAFIFSENSIQPAMEKLVNNTRVALQNAWLPEELEKEIAIYHAMIGNTAEYRSKSARASAELAAQFTS